MRNRKGFTLVELLVVIAIIGLLATIAFIALNQARAKARDAKRVSDVRELASALELYYNDQTTPGYPAVDIPTVMAAAILPATYVATVPQAPTPPDNPSGSTVCTAGTGATDPDGTNNYVYESMKSQQDQAACTATVGDPCGWYELSFCLGSATGGLTAGVHTATPAGIQ